MLTEKTAIQLLDLFDQKQFYTSQQLADNFGVCEKTMRSQLKELKMILNGHGAVLGSVPGKGYELRVEDSRMFTEWRNAAFSPDESVTPVTREERKFFLLGKLMTTKKYTKIEDIADKMFVSRNVVSSIISEIEDTDLPRYYLSIERKPYYGIRINGSEFYKRLYWGSEMVLSSHHTALFEKYFRENYRKARTAIDEWMRHNNVRFNHETYHAFITYVQVACARYNQGLTIEETMDYPVNPYIPDLIGILEKNVFEP